MCKYTGSFIDDLYTEYFYYNSRRDSTGGRAYFGNVYRESTEGHGSGPLRVCDGDRSNVMVIISSVNGTKLWM